MVIANAEHFVVANDLLFRLVKPKKSLDSQMKCLLVIPEKFKHRFSCFMILSLVPIMVQSRPTILSKIGTGCIICLRNLRGIFPHVMLVSSRNKNEVRQYFHPRILLSYNPKSYLSADIKYMPKGIYSSL